MSPTTVLLREPSARRRGAAYTALALAALAVFVIALVIARNVVTGNGGDLNTPNVVGQSYADAQSTLSAQGLRVGTVTDEYSATQAKGTIVSQQPPAGILAGKGQRVDLVISEGIEYVLVPGGLVGLSENDAKTALAAAHLKVGRVIQMNSAVPAGQVLTTDPVEGSTVAAGSKVTITVSNSHVKVPDVTGQDEATATALLQQEGFNVVVKPAAVYTPKDDGLIVSQTPVGGTYVNSGATITIYVDELGFPSDTPTPTASPTDSPTPEETVPASLTAARQESRPRRRAIATASVRLAASSFAEHVGDVHAHRLGADEQLLRDLAVAAAGRDEARARRARAASASRRHATSRAPRLVGRRSPASRSSASSGRARAAIATSRACVGLAARRRLARRASDGGQPGPRSCRLVDVTERARTPRPTAARLDQLVAASSGSIAGQPVQPGAAPPSTRSPRPGPRARCAASLRRSRRAALGELVAAAHQSSRSAALCAIAAAAAMCPSSKRGEPDPGVEAGPLPQRATCSTTSSCIC